MLNCTPCNQDLGAKNAAVSLIGLHIPPTEAFLFFVPSSCRGVANPLLCLPPSSSPSASIYPSPATGCHLTFGVRSDGEEKKVTGKRARGGSYAWGEGKKKTGEQYGSSGWRLRWGFGVKGFVCVFVCVSSRCTQKEEAHAFAWMRILCVWAYFCVFVFVCPRVCFPVCLHVRVCVWVRVGTHPQRAAHGGGSFTISSPKRHIKLSPFLWAPPCFFPMLPLFSHVFPSALLTLCFLCPLCYFTILRSSALPLSLPSRICGFTPLLPSSPPALLWFPLHSLLLLLSTLVYTLSLVSASFLSSLFFVFSLFNLPSSLSLFLFFFCPRVCKVMQGHVLSLWIETFKTTVSFMHKHAGKNTQSCTQAHMLVKDKKITFALILLYIYVT